MRDTHTHPLSFEDSVAPYHYAKEIARFFKINTLQKWHSASIAIKCWGWVYIPEDPSKYYPEFVSWDDFAKG